jgi:cellulose synthase/poly-beta-1,6-N-acetylglucosamine synthase-like glycosyltransferase
VTVTTERPRLARPARPDTVLARPDTVLEVPSDLTTRYLDEAITQLRFTQPDLSAFTRTTTWQRRGAIGLGLLILVSAVAFPVYTLRLVFGLITLVYFSVLFYKLRCLHRGMQLDTMVRIPADEARAYPADQLPTYSVLIPAYREPTVITDLLTRIEAMDYPRRKLQVLVLLEEDDDETLAAIRAAKPQSYVRTIIVPASEPRTKPKACNYGLRFATGEFITIYDAEDRPEPLQLRRAAIAFESQPSDVVCLQALLGYHNPKQNRITEWFSAEYLSWFAHLLPGLVSLDVPIPLGGTSNHMRTETVRELGGWDPYNVTEDADLGVRLHRRGMRTRVLDSVTEEEANSDFINWVKQRSRWYKGYLQTWLVHMRHPRQLRKQIGLSGIVGMTLFVGGTPMLALLNPIFWTLTLLWLIIGPGFIETFYPWPTYFVALFCMVIGNALMIYMGLLSIRHQRRPELVISVLTVPVYWLMMSLSAVKAFAQLVRAPSFWEKTTHGLFR